RAYVEQVLVQRQSSDLVIIDDLTSRSAKAVRSAIRAAGAGLFFLPPYSPYLNPMEQLLAKLKTPLRRPPNAPLKPPGSTSHPRHEVTAELPTKTSRQHQPFGLAQFFRSPNPWTISGNQVVTCSRIIDSSRIGGAEARSFSISTIALSRTVSAASRVMSPRLTWWLSSDMIVKAIASSISSAGERLIAWSLRCRKLTNY